MTQTIVDFFQSVTGNNYLTLFLVSIIPIIELRGAIILIAGMPDVHRIAGMFVSLAGSSVVIIPLLLCLRPILNKLKKTKLFGKIAAFFEDLFQSRAEGVNKKAQEGKMTKKLSSDAKKFLGLSLFVGVPLPFTGAWTGSGVGAFMDFKLWKAALAVFIGNFIAACILTLLTAFIPVKYIDIILYAFLALVVLSLVISFTVAVVKRKKKKAMLAAESSKKDEGDVQAIENGQESTDNTEDPALCDKTSQSTAEETAESINAVTDGTDTADLLKPQGGKKTDMGILHSEGENEALGHGADVENAKEQSDGENAKAKTDASKE